jgi:hypothetical protein
MQQYKLPKELEVYLDILNQIFEVEKKLIKVNTKNSISRNTNRIKELFQENLPLIDGGFFVENPIGEPYSETRIELDASIAGEGHENLEIVEVIKPVIRFRQSGFNHLIQKGIVIVESKKENTNE